MKSELPIDAKEAAILDAQSESLNFGQTIWREIKNDKMAIVALIILSIILLISYIGPFFIDQVEAKRH